MKTKLNFIKKLRKGMTLLELVIAMALTTIVFAGAGVALFSINKTSKQETKNHVCLNEAKTISYAIDKLFKSDEKVAINNISFGDNLGKNGCSNLFTFVTSDDSQVYGFEKNKFGIVSDNKIEGENIKFTSTYEMYFSIKKDESEKFVEFVIHYGTNYTASLSLVERL